MLPHSVQETKKLFLKRKFQGKPSTPYEIKKGDMRVQSHNLEGSNSHHCTVISENRALQYNENGGDR
jgi:hypothetical protein